MLVNLICNYRKFRERLMARKITSAIAALLFATTLTACGSGVDAPTRLIQQVTDGVEANVSTEDTLLYVRNLYISVNQVGDANLIATIVNQKEKEDALIALAINNQEVKIDPLPAKLNTPVIFGGPSSNASATLPAANLVVGNRYPVSLFFGVSGSVTLDALAVAE
jgi:hypothetical protein